MRQALRNRETMAEFVYSPAPVKGHSVVIVGAEAGRYEVAWFDSQSGIWGETDTVEVVEGKLLIPLPTFDRDIAARITVVR